MTTEFLKSSDAFEKIFRHSPAAMAKVDTEEFKTIDINSAFETLYGNTREEVTGKTSIELQLYEDMKQSDLIHCEEI